jgi:para-aminobenzoate synthetase / 4-amino-4-deoxychorismate lyase
MRILIEFEQKPLLFQNPQRMIVCQTPQDMERCFQEVEDTLSKGYYLAGFLSYEAGYGFEPSLMPFARGYFPLLCFGVYDTPLRKHIVDQRGAFAVSDMTTNVSKEDYIKAIDAVREAISLGDVYQITYCIKKLFSFKGDAYALYRALLSSQPVPYPAFVEYGPYQILSLSPEMFFWKKGAKIITKPMKGSWPSHGRVMDKLFGGLFLKHDQKNRAENVMIADLLRNDLGRIATHIRAPRLFEVARYKTIFQMTSSVSGQIDDSVNVARLFKAIFPSGSVTGAPKMRAMQIIRALEKEERRIYTGAIGYITPGREMFFNVPIRTLLLEDGRGEMGVGGGIVWDSTPDGEWDESTWKSRFLEALC